MCLFKHTSVDRLKGTTMNHTEQQQAKGQTRVQLKGTSLAPIYVSLGLAIAVVLLVYWFSGKDDVAVEAAVIPPPSTPKTVTSKSKSQLPSVLSSDM